MRKDGLHPNVEGLEVILEYIRTHGYVPPKSIRKAKKPIHLS